MKLGSKSVFNVIGTSDGYFQIEFDQAVLICVFACSCPLGRYQFKRMSFGICSVPEVFQKKDMEMFCDIDDVHIYFDKLYFLEKIMYDEALSKLANRAKALGLIKTNFYTKLVKFRFSGF